MLNRAMTGALDNDIWFELKKCIDGIDDRKLTFHVFSDFCYACRYIHYADQRFRFTARRKAPDNFFGNGSKPDDRNTFFEHPFGALK